MDVHPPVIILYFKSRVLSFLEFERQPLRSSLSHIRDCGNSPHLLEMGFLYMWYQESEKTAALQRACYISLNRRRCW